MMAFVTVIGLEDIMYNFQNQGMAVITSWVLMMFLYVVPYALIVGHLGSVSTMKAVAFPLGSEPLTVNF